MRALRRHPYTLYLLKFGGLFGLFYFGILAIIGLSSVEGLYSPVVARYLNFIAPLRHSLLLGARTALQALHYPAELQGDYVLRLTGGPGVRMVYSCIGYGVMSFWAAFVVANSGSFRRKTAWLLAGLTALWCLNVLRIVLLLVTLQQQRPMPFGLDHHTLFNVAAYGAIFLLMYLYDRLQTKPLPLNEPHENRPVHL